MHANGRVAQRGPLVDGLQHGEWTSWFPSGTVKERGHYERDEPTGEWTYWWENGALRMRGSFRGDRQEGLWEFWHDDGSPHCSGEFRDGRLHGEWTFHQRSGAPLQRGVYWSGRRELHWTECDAEGGATLEGSRFADQRVGAWRRTAVDGTVTHVTYTIPPGMEHVLERWDDGSVRREGFLRDGVAHGVWVTRHRGGALRAFVEFAAGQPSGELTCKSSSGAMLARGPLVNGRPQGTWLVSAPGGDTTIEVRREPHPPWDRRWSETAVETQEPPLAVAERWLDELCSPATRAVLAVDPPRLDPPAAADSPPLEPPTDPGEWTVRERGLMALVRRYFRDGWLPRHNSVAREYGGPADGTRLGKGDPLLAQAIIGKLLPVTTFPTADGELLDLASLRGKRVLLVVMRGHTKRICLYCYAQTLEITPHCAEWAKLECEVVVLFPGPKSHLQAFAAACARELGDRKPPFRLVYDADLQLARALGLEGNLARPASFALDRQGVVRNAYIAESELNIADRPSAEDLMRWILKLP